MANMLLQWLICLYDKFHFRPDFSTRNIIRRRVLHKSFVCATYVCNTPQNGHKSVAVARKKTWCQTSNLLRLHVLELLCVSKSRIILHVEKSNYFACRKVELFCELKSRIILRVEKSGSESEPFRVDVIMANIL